MRRRAQSEDGVSGRDALTDPDDGGGGLDVGAAAGGDGLVSAHVLLIRALRGVLKLEKGISIHWQKGTLRTELIEPPLIKRSDV